jgi:hypothetical protein
MRNTAAVKGGGGEGGKTKAKTKTKIAAKSQARDHSQIPSGKGDSVLAVAVENGATSNKGRGGNLVAVKQPHQPNLPAVHSAK